MDKIQLIQKITDFHPAYEPGRKRGWSHYTGGMADTGDWFYKKLFVANEQELEECLKELEAIKNAPEQIFTEEELADMKIIVKVSDGIWSNMYQIKLMKKMLKKQEMQMLWGK